MCSKYNRLLLSTCISIFAFGTFTNNPAHAEFKWTPPDEPDYVEDAGPDVFIVDDEAMSSDVALDSALPEYYDIRLEEIVFEDEPPIEVKILEQDTDRDGEKSVEIKTINFSDKKEEAVETEAPQNKVGSLVLDPYPLKDDGSVKDDGSASEEEDRQVDVQMHSPPVSVGVSYEVIEGFGMKIPLALALSQIVPAKYAYSFSDSVNLGARVSWEGGKPWNEVLNDALSPLGIKAVIHDKKVVLKTDTENSEQAAAPQAAQKKNEFSEPIKKLAVAELGEDGARELAVSPEQAMSAALEEKTPSIEGEAFFIEEIIDAEEMPEVIVSSESILSAPTTTNSVVLDKTATGSEMADNDNTVSALVDDLMKPEEANPFEKSATDEIVLSDSKDSAMKTVSDGEATSAPLSVPLVEEEEASVSQVNEIIPDYSSMGNAEDQITISSDVSKEDVVEAPEQVSHYLEKPSNKIRIWQAKSKSGLQTIIEEWSAKERVPLAWKATKEYALDYDVFISGTYKNAVDILFKKGLKRAPEYVLSETPYGLSVQKEED